MRPQLGSTVGVSGRGAGLGELSDRVADLPVEDHRPVTTMIESKTYLPSRSRPISWWASQAIELDLLLPAEC